MSATATLDHVAEPVFGRTYSEPVVGLIAGETKRITTTSGQRILLTPWSICTRGRSDEFFEADDEGKAIFGSNEHELLAAVRALYQSPPGFQRIFLGKDIRGVLDRARQGHINPNAPVYVSEQPVPISGRSTAEECTHQQLIDYLSDANTQHTGSEYLPVYPVNTRHYGRLAIEHRGPHWLLSHWYPDVDEVEDLITSRIGRIPLFDGWYAQRESGGYSSYGVHFLLSYDTKIYEKAQSTLKRWRTSRSKRRKAKAAVGDHDFARLRPADMLQHVNDTLYLIGHDMRQLVNDEKIPVGADFRPMHTTCAGLFLLPPAVGKGSAWALWGPKKKTAYRDIHRYKNLMETLVLHRYTTEGRLRELLTRAGKSIHDFYNKYTEDTEETLAGHVDKALPFWVNELAIAMKKSTGLRKIYKTNPLLLTAETKETDN
jgi:hypothetical protein